MADIADVAQMMELELDTSEISYRFTKPSLEFCEECGFDIPKKRQELGGVTHCIDCQTFLEKISKRN